MCSQNCLLNYCVYVHKTVELSGQKRLFSFFLSLYLFFFFCKLNLEGLFLSNSSSTWLQSTPQPSLCSQEPFFTGCKLRPTPGPIAKPAWDQQSRAEFRRGRIPKELKVRRRRAATWCWLCGLAGGLYLPALAVSWESLYPGRCGFQESQG